MTQPARGLVVAAPSSGSGKTVFTLGLLRLLARRDLRVASAKTGPDYIDPAFHAAATGCPCINIDPWAMGSNLSAAAAAYAAADTDLLVCEGVMGLFDGATANLDGNDGSTADLAARLGWPVVLVVDAGAQGASAAAVVKGFAQFRSDVTIRGVVFNKVGPGRHAELLRAACAKAVPDVDVLGCIPRINDLEVPSRHLGLVQAMEIGGLDAFLDRAADLVGEHVDVDRLTALSQTGAVSASSTVPTPIAPLGQHIAVARDEAFAFAYPLVLEGWRAQGATLSFFSPLANEAPDESADAVYLPGGYPELHAAKLSANEAFLGGLRRAADAGAAVFGECGGFMVLGRTLTDADGTGHAMAGLLDLETSFAARRLHLGYRTAQVVDPSTLNGAFSGGARVLKGHEFHYATIVRQQGAPLFTCKDASGKDLGPLGLVSGSVAGSFIHLIAAP